MYQQRIAALGGITAVVLFLIGSAIYWVRLQGRAVEPPQIDAVEMYQAQHTPSAAIKATVATDSAATLATPNPTPYIPSPPARSFPKQLLKNDAVVAGDSRQYAVQFQLSMEDEAVPDGLAERAIEVRVDDSIVWTAPYVAGLDHRLITIWLDRPAELTDIDISVSTSFGAVAAQNVSITHLQEKQQLNVEEVDVRVRPNGIHSYLLQATLPVEQLGVLYQQYGLSQDKRNLQLEATAQGLVKVGARITELPFDLPPDESDFHPYLSSIDHLQPALVRRRDQVAVVMAKRLTAGISAPKLDLWYDHYANGELVTAGLSMPIDQTAVGDWLLEQPVITQTCSGVDCLAHRSIQSIVGELVAVWEDSEQIVFPITIVFGQ